jgi:pimeloyl-ACP methyl ester carboxylesterase
MSSAPAVNLVGNGRHKIICLNGWFGHAGGWGPMVDHLDRDDFSYAFMDYRGYGARKGSGGPYTMQQIADDVLALADDLGWATFSLLGHSMGGMAIQQVLANVPERVRALVGITPVPASGVPFDEQGWELFSSAAGSLQVRRVIIDLTTGNRLTPTWVNAMAQVSLEQSDQEAFAAYLSAWARTDLSGHIVGKALPVLVVAGQHDPALGEQTCKATWMMHYPNAQLIIMGNAGHYPMDETPVALVTEIEQFLRRQADD